MRDDQLTQLLRQVDEPAYPDSVFADRLFDQLTREAARSRGRNTPLLLVAALVLASLVAVGAAVGSGVLHVPWVTVEVTPPPSGLAEATQSAAPSSRAPVVSVPDGTLPALTNITVVHGPIPLRDAPDTAASVVGTLEAGQQFQVYPLTALDIDGVPWYRVTTSSSDTSHWIQLDPRSGNVTVDPVACPSGDPSFRDLVAMTEWSRLACFGDREFTVQGIEVTGVRGTGPGTFTPTWLASPFAFRLALGPSSQAYLLVRAPDSVAVPPAPANLGNRYRIFQVTGHFDDATASTCRITGIPYGDNSSPPAEIDPANGVLYCREQFVATTFTFTGTAEPTAAPVASGEPTPVVEVPDGLLPPGSKATVMVDGLRIRNQPSTSAPVLATLAKGDSVTISHYITMPVPVIVEGVPWYAINLAFDPFTGWVAAEDGGTPFLALSEPATCEDLRPGPVTLQQLIAADSWHRLACLGDTPVTVTGVYVLACQGGTADPSTFGPHWLIDFCATQLLTPQEGAKNFPANALDTVTAPELGQSFEPFGTIARVTGHFDDPASTTCFMNFDGGTTTVASGAAALDCREQFVVTKIEVLGSMTLPPIGP
jgi:hypothetical protein